LRFGPFPKKDLPKIEEALTSANLGFQIVEDDAATVILDISDEELEKLDPDLETLGLGLPVPDFHGQDFVCPKCEHSQETAGACPKDGETLLEFSDFAAHKRTTSPTDKYFFYGVMGLVVAAVAAYVLFS
jgi:hypothetical protein